MKKVIFGVLAFLVLATSCTKDNVCNKEYPATTNLITPKVTALVAEPFSSTSPLTGILEIYPCIEASSIYYGNYVNGKLTSLNGYYSITNGHITNNNTRELSLPMNTYNMVYWGTPQYNSPTYSSPAIVEPGVSIGADLTTLYFKLRSNNDETYRPVFDLVYAINKVNVGEEDLNASLVRVVSGIKVIVRQKGNNIFSPNITAMEARIGGIAEQINLYTAEPENMTKTVKFNLTRSEDNTEMSNNIAMVFPSSPKPLFELYITLKDGSVHKLSQNIESTLLPNTRLTLNIIIGEIHAGGSQGNFSIENWNEANETIEFPMVD